MTPEFARPLRANDIGSADRQLAIEADANERRALAERFALLSLDRLTAAFVLRREAAGVRLTGQVHASGDQACVATAVPVPFLITEAVKLLLTETAPTGDEIELAEADLETEQLNGEIIDAGEIAAQALALALDPYPRSTKSTPGLLTETEARAAASPFAILGKPKP